ncbi:MAG: O-antigen ligase family protein [Pseudomonadota bacterium]
MIDTPSAERTLKLRLKLAWWAMPFVIAVPVLATIWMFSSSVNALTSWVLLGFSLLLLPETCHQIQQWWKTRAFKLAALTLLFCITAWHFYQGDLWLNAQARLYVSVLLFGAALCAWFERTGDAGLRWVALLKIAVTCFAALSILSVIFSVSLKTNIWSELAGSPPIYRNIRHFNSELMMATALLCLFWGGATRIWQHSVLLTIFALSGYLSVVSAARGALLALAVFGIALAIGKLVHTIKTYLLPALAFLIGGALAFLTGQTSYVLGRAGQLNGAENVSSGRIEIWGNAFHILLETRMSLLFGYGPDSFRNLLSGQYHKLIQPHNAFVQWLMDFGLLGGIVLGLFWIRLNLASLRRLRAADTLDTNRIMAALLLAIFVLSLVDGLMYTATALIIVVITGAYLIKSEEQRHGPKTAATLP